MSPSDRVAQLYPQARGSLFVAFYDSQGYGGGILTHLHKGICLNQMIKKIVIILKRTETCSFRLGAGRKANDHAV
jgi:hypothetical protein